MVMMITAYAIMFFFVFYNYCTVSNNRQSSGVQSRGRGMHALTIKTYAIMLFCSFFN